MEKVFLSECHSTQDYLKNQIGKGWEHPCCVASAGQTSGRGQRGKKWLDFDKSIALSLSLKPCQNMTLTPLKIGVLFCDFWKKEFGFDLFLKWPNDILNSRREKVAGILCEVLSKDLLVVGLGVNILGKPPQQKFDYPAASLFFESPTRSLEEISFSLAEFITTKDLNEDEIISRWMEKCSHKDMKIAISDDSEHVSGKFIGLDELGRCGLETNEAEQKFFVSGSLRIL